MDPTNQANNQYPQQVPPFPQQPQQPQQPKQTAGGGVETEQVAEAESAITPAEQKEQEPYSPEQESTVQTDKNYLIRENSQTDDPVQEEQSAEKILGMKMSGYGVSSSLAQMKGKYSSMQGKGSVEKSSSWLIMLLDRILKKESLRGNSAS